MVCVSASQAGAKWFAVAMAGDDLVASAVGPDRDGAISAVRHCIRAGVDYSLLENPDQCASATIEMLGELEEGHEENKRFSLSRDHIPDVLFRVLSTAAAIPLGYVTTYGDVARVAGSEPRAVGRIMATNPLYPVVPCHRVVGAAMTLVGYGGRQDDSALIAKLGRLRSELRGHTEAIEVSAPRGNLPVFPAELVIEASRDLITAQRDNDLQISLFQ